MDAENHLKLKETTSELSDFYFVLDEHDIKNISLETDKNNRIIAIGREAISSQIHLLTGDCRFLTINPKILPEGRVKLSSDGKSVYFYDAKKEYDSSSLISGYYLFQ